MQTAWRKSSYSGNGDNGNCVEVAFGGPVVAVRDSKNPVAVIAVPRGAWVAFVAGRPQRGGRPARRLRPGTGTR